jgi:hypothetical protein
VREECYGPSTRPNKTFLVKNRHSCSTRTTERLCRPDASGKENPILFASQNRNQVGIRVGWVIRLKVETSLIGRPGNGGSRAQERAFEGLGSVVNPGRRQRAVPDDIERYRRMNWEDRRDGRIGKAEALSERIRDVVIVEDTHVRNVEFSVRIVKMDPDRAVPDWNHPEDVVAVDMHVVVVDLCGQSNRTGVQIKSNKDERATMRLAVGSDECALTETHVRLERHARGSASISVGSRAAATNVG